MEPVNRKLIRPSFNEAKSEAKGPKPHGRPDGGAKRSSPPDQTNAENFYYLKQMQSKTPMVIVLQDDEKVRGIIDKIEKETTVTCRSFNKKKPDEEAELVKLIYNNAWEKNWGFFEHDRELLAVYSISPHRILRIGARGHSGAGEQGRTAERRRR